MKPMQYQSRAERKARAMIHERPTIRLVTDYELLEALPATESVLLSRLWIQDELEMRNPEAYAAWEETWMMDSPRAYFLPA